MYKEGRRERGQKELTSSAQPLWSTFWEAPELVRPRLYRVCCGLPLVVFFMLRIIYSKSPKENAYQDPSHFFWTMFLVPWNFSPNGPEPTPRSVWASPVALSCHGQKVSPVTQPQVRAGQGNTAVRRGSGGELVELGGPGWNGHRHVLRHPCSVDWGWG